MSGESVTLRLGGTLKVDEFAKTAERFAELLAALAEEEGLGWGVTWFLGGLEYGSAAITAELLADSPETEEAAPRIVTRYLKAAREVREGRLDDDRRTRRLVRSIAERATPDAEVTFETAEAEVIFLSAPTPDEMEELEPPPVLPGAVRGRIQTLSQRGGLRFTLYDLLTDRAVSCYISPGKEELLRNAWGHLADVTGVITRDPRTDRPLAVRRVTEIRVLPDAEPEAFLKARGAVAAAEGAPPSEEILRVIRDAG